MFEKQNRTTLQVIENLLDEYNRNCYSKRPLQQIQPKVINKSRVHLFVEGINDFLNRSSNERNMTRKTRLRQPRIYSAIQSGYCAVCHSTYNSIEEHIQSKRHLKLIGEDASIISLNGYLDDDSFYDIDIDEINKTCEYFPQLKRKMPRTRRNSITERIIKEQSMSPSSDIGHHRLRSRKNINYMTPPLDDDSLYEKPEHVKEYRELRSSTRLLAKLTEQINGNGGEEVWNSGRPKRSCSNKHRYSADERLVVDNKSYYKVDILPTKLRSGQQQFNNSPQQQHQHHYYTRRPETPPNTNDDDKLIFKFKKLRNSELVQLNNEAENFLFGNDNNRDEKALNENVNEIKEINENENKNSEDDKTTTTRHNNSTNENKQKKRRRTHAEVFISDNEKYYKFEMPGTRLRYQGSYLPSVTSWTQKSPKGNGDCTSGSVVTTTETTDGLEEDEVKFHPKPSKKSPHINLADYKFSFEDVPEKEDWYQAFQRQDKGQERYHFCDDYSYWDPLILPYQVGPLPPLDPQECIEQYKLLKKCLTEPPSSVSTTASCSTPDPCTSNSNSSVECQSLQDEDSKISATMTEVSSSSTLDEFKTLQRKRRTVPKVKAATGRNPRKSPRQHASTLAILSSLLHQRKRKSRSPNKNLPTIREENEKSPNNNKKKVKIDHFEIARNIDDELTKLCSEPIIETEFSSDGIQFNKSTIDIIDILNIYDQSKLANQNSNNKRTKTCAGRKPGKKKKNRTGWPNTNKRMRKPVVQKDTDNNMESEIDDNYSTDSINNKTKINKSESVVNNNNKNNDQTNSLLYDNNDNNCDDRVDEDENDDKLCNNKVNNNSSDNLNLENLQLQPYVRVQKLDKNNITVAKDRRRKTTPKRTNRGQRRMPASPRSPRMLRRPRGRWYRER